MCRKAEIYRAVLEGAEYENLHQLASVELGRAVGKAAALQTRKLVEQVNALQQTLRVEALQLEQWANESRSGGWSAHQVDPMRKRAAELRKLADS